MNEDEYKAGALADFISNEVLSGKKKKQKKKQDSEISSVLNEDNVDVTEIFKTHSSLSSGKVYQSVNLKNDSTFSLPAGTKLTNKQAAAIRMQKKQGIKSELLLSVQKKTKKAVKKNDSDDEEDAEQEKKPSLEERNAPKEKNLEQEKRTVFLGNVPSIAKKKELIKLCKPFGKIETVRFRGVAPAQPFLSKKLAANK